MTEDDCRLFHSTERDLKALQVRAISLSADLHELFKNYKPESKQHTIDLFNRLTLDIDGIDDSLHDLIREIKD